MTVLNKYFKRSHTITLEILSNYMANLMQLLPHVKGLRYGKINFY